MPILHHTKTLSALLPRYVTRFACTGPACEDTCCADWRVTLDKKTFNAYRQSKHPELAKVVAVSIKRQRSGASDANYGRIELRQDNGQCPLVEDRLCSIQKKLDETHLSDTCFSYPRQTRSFGGQTEQVLTLSCPEAARQALLEPDAFDFVEGQVTLRPATLDAVRPVHGLTLAEMDAIRAFCLNLMRVQGLELWQRLAVLGVFCESLDKALAAGRQGTVEKLINDCASMVEGGQVADALAQMPANHAVQAKVFATLWGRKRTMTASVQQNAVVERVARGLGGDETGQVGADALVAAYSRGVARLPEALQAAPHLLEHYLLNEMFGTLFPFNCADVYTSYLRLVSRFGLLRLMLAAQCAGDGPLPDAAALVQTVQVYARRFLHTPRFAAEVDQALKTSGWASLDKLYGFLRT